MNLRKLQRRQAEWQSRNFPENEPWMCLAGITEEVGELNHAVLKGAQGIRHTPEEIRNMKADAVGDIVIYLAGFCTDHELDLEECVGAAWAEVEKRDWRK